MFGGGEEYFQPPAAYDIDTLQRFCQFCAKLRQVSKPGKKTINEICELAHAVGDTLDSYELVVGSIFRHIKTWKGQRQLAHWYVLDKLCKESPDKYGFCASKYVLEIGRDYMPFDDPDYRAKYETLVEHWENVFPRHVVDAIWMSKKEKVWAAQNPEEYQKQLQQEEEEWRQTEMAMEDEDGLNAFGQPCMDYLQGRCTWGANCSLYHPPGEEGTLPPECRMGDWKCSACGVINRHFRRRCANCVREKPQYKRGRERAVEDRLLSSPDPRVVHMLHQQFGYNPYDEEEAREQWRRRLQDVSVATYLEERRAAYKVRILGRPATTPLEQRCQVQKHFPEPELLDTFTDDASAPKRIRTESLVPMGTPADKAVGLLTQLAMERGVRDGMAPQIYEALAGSIGAVAEDASMTLSPAIADNFISAVTLAVTAWQRDGASMEFVSEFLRSVRGAMSQLGLTTIQSNQLASMISAIP